MKTKLLLILLVWWPALSRPAESRPLHDELSTLSKGDTVHGFRAAAVYLNDAAQPSGARVGHRKSGFRLDLLRIDSVPQAFTWVNSCPVSDQGEPHTQEHLLVGKGNTGRAFAVLDTMWLAEP